MTDKLKKILLLTGAFSVLVIIQSCCDCTDCLIKQSEPACEVKNNAMIEFRAGVKDTTVKTADGRDSTYYKPLPDFAVETFGFPDNNQSSGYQPSDPRFSKSPLRVAEEKFTFAGREYTAVIFDLIPPNKEILGDILVSRVEINTGDPMLSTAYLRFYGDVTRYSADFPSENSGDFCEKFVPENTNLENLRKYSSRHGAKLKDDKGKDLTNQLILGAYSEADITVLDSDGKDVTGISVPQDLKDKLLADANAKSQVDIIVSPGQVYYVKARNTREFALQITGISEGIFPTDAVKKKRVYIMFTPL